MKWPQKIYLYALGSVHIHTEDLASAPNESKVAEYVLNNYGVAKVTAEIVEEDSTQYTEGEV